LKNKKPLPNKGYMQ